MYITHARGVQYEPDYETRNKSCFCVHPKIAGILVGLLEVLQFLANLLLLIGAIIHHDQIWSIILTSIALVMICAMIAVLFIGILKNRPHFIYVHLLYLILSVVWYAIILTLVIISFFFTDTIIDVYDKKSNVREVAHAYIIVFVIVSTIMLLIRVYTVIVIRRLYRYVSCKHIALVNTQRNNYSGANSGRQYHRC
uniref:MARVEL domain-containing protein n=1 Tax=Steinernema glaseri TaxID=37863 RepID=A0A1I8AMY1_9BILA